MNHWKYVIIGLSITMYLPDMLATYGIYHHLKAIQLNLGDTYVFESMYLSAYMFIFSAVIWLPYSAIIYLGWNNFSKKLRTITSIPFLWMLAMTLYITYEGTPW